MYLRYSQVDAEPLGRAPVGRGSRLRLLPHTYIHTSRNARVATGPMCGHICYIQLRPESSTGFGSFLLENTPTIHSILLLTQYFLVFSFLFLSLSNNGKITSVLACLTLFCAPNFGFLFQGIINFGRIHSVYHPMRNASSMAFPFLQKSR